jgi:hypothetical protein
MIHPLLSRLFSVAALVSPLLPLHAAGASTFYDIDFEQPNNIPGQPIPTGPGGNQVSDIFAGNISVAAFPGAGSNAALFNTAGNGESFYYDTIELQTSAYYSIHHLSLDLLASDLIGSTNQFTIFFDTPRVQTIRFMADGYVWIKETNRAAQFSENENIHLEITATPLTDSWEVWMNGVSIYNGLYESDNGRLRSIRMALGLPAGGAPNHSTNVFVDNIVAVVPEPSAACLLGLGLFGIWKRRR